MTQWLESTTKTNDTQYAENNYKNTKMQVNKVKISEVKTNPKNPRLIKDDKFRKLVKSIQEFPQMLELRPIVVDENNIVLGGNMRLKACKEAGLKEVYIVKAENLTELQKDEFIVKDNVGFGEWDWDMLANEWDTEKLDEWGLDLPVILDSSDDDLKDLSSTIDNLYRIEIVCKDEEHQENTYNKLIEQGYECRLLTL
jgi:ParB-like chromosome segregation protein Spo0J